VTKSLAILDTSFVVRYLTGDPPKPARVAKDVIDGEAMVGLTDVAVVETAYVLTTRYRVPRDVAVDALVGLTRRRNVATLGASKEFVVLGLLMCRGSGRVSFGDAMIWAVARSKGVETVYSFDEHFSSDGLTVRST
jgi:predicted nucleic acid-binding protein